MTGSAVSLSTGTDLTGSTVRCFYRIVAGASVWEGEDAPSAQFAEKRFSIAPTSRAERMMGSPRERSTANSATSVESTYADISLEIRTITFEPSVLWLRWKSITYLSLKIQQIYLLLCTVTPLHGPTC
jgi:hypothetical protein